MLRPAHRWTWSTHYLVIPIWQFKQDACKLALCIITVDHFLHKGQLCPSTPHSQQTLWPVVFRTHVHGDSCMLYAWVCIWLYALVPCPRQTCGSAGFTPRVCQYTQASKVWSWHQIMANAFMPDLMLRSHFICLRAVVVRVHKAGCGWKTDLHQAQVVHSSGATPALSGSPPVILVHTHICVVFSAWLSSSFY